MNFLRFRAEERPYVLRKETDAKEFNCVSLCFFLYSKKLLLNVCYLELYSCSGDELHCLNPQYLR
jgi:hypothetical protein